MRFAFAFAVLASNLLCADAMLAQSGSSSQPRYTQPQRSQGQGSQAQGSGAHNMTAQGSGNMAKKVAMRGYCPVALVENQQWVKGTPQHAAEYDGKTYYFLGAEPLAMFNANPVKYLPALGGDDVVAYTNTGRRTPGKLANGVVYEGRIFFFADAANKQAFQASPERFENADLALGGNCVVCQVNMNKQMPGNPKFTYIHGGMRFQFPGAEQLNMFRVAPEQFTSQAMGSGNKAGSGSNAGSGSQPRRTPAGSGSGSY